MLWSERYHMSAASKPRISKTLLIGVGVPLAIALVAIVAIALSQWDDPIRRAESLVHSGKIVGMTRAELDRRFGRAYRAPESQWDVMYGLGRTKSFMPIGDTVLLIEFDEHARVARARVSGD